MESPFKIFNAKSLEGKRLIADNEVDTIANQIWQTCSTEELRLVIKWLNGVSCIYPENATLIIENYFQNISLPFWANTPQSRMRSCFL